MISTHGVETGTGSAVDGRPRLVDLDGDGRPELLGVNHGTADRWPALQVLWIKAAN